MKRMLKVLLLTGVALGLASAARGSDRWETLRAINWVENPTNHTRTGRFGELGPYQFRAATWRMHTSKPFSLAIDRATADEVAIKHYEWIKRIFAQAGVEATPFNIAMAWNCGVDAVLTGRVPNVSYGYAERVSNLVDTFKSNEQSLTNAPSEPVQPAGDSAIPTGGVRFRVLQDTPRFVIAAS